MPNTREKLIEFMANLDCNAEYCKDCEFCEDIDGCVRRQKEIIADRLIANGVTVQKWIPVTERLPEIGDTYLVVVKYKYDHEKEYGYDVDVAMYCPYDDPDAYIDKRWNTFIDWNEGQQYLHVTHWMPLPQPPKEMPEETVYCKDCENLMFSDCYGECAKAYKGIVRPDDTCEHGVRRTPKGEQ